MVTDTTLTILQEKTIKYLCFPHLLNNWLLQWTVCLITIPNLILHLGTEWKFCPRVGKTLTKESAKELSLFMLDMVILYQQG